MGALATALCCAGLGAQESDAAKATAQAAPVGQAEAGQAASGKARYYVVFLRRDPQRKVLTEAEGEQIQAAHMANIRQMAADGVLVSAGPFDDTPAEISGMFVFAVDSLGRAQRIAEQDPTLAQHRNTAEVHAWDGPAGIGAEYFRLHKADPKTPENMQMHPLCLLYRGAAWGKVRSKAAVMGAHESYIAKLKGEGKLGAAGQVDADPSGGGAIMPAAGADALMEMVIFRAMAVGDAQSLMREDPAVAAGLLKVEFHQWWSSDHVLPW